MWTVVFCPKVGFYLSNVDTNLKNTKCPQYQYGHFLVDSSLQWTAVAMILLWTLLCGQFVVDRCGHDISVDTSLCTDSRMLLLWTV